MAEYNHLKIEKKWQNIWDKKKVFQAQNYSKKPKFYSLIEFPYPSGAGMHVGHIRSNTAMDIISRKRRMEGYNVLFPIGWDAFGLPTENYAIKTGIHPIKVTKDNTNTFRRQLKALGFSFDWSREINTTNPKYYKWTQWIFLQFFKKGLAYKKKMAVNWCPKDKIVLANEEVVDGKCERCGTAVEQREKEQWMLAITKYADRLDKDLDTVDYLPQIKLGQRNWIGRSEGVEIEFKIHTHPLTPSQREGGFGYQTTDSKTWRTLQEKAVEMRENPTEAEKKLWQYLKGNMTHPNLPKGKEEIKGLSLGGRFGGGEFHFRQQHIIDKFIVDFVCLSKNLIIEVDGDIHDLQKEKDEERTDILQTLGYEIIRFRNEEVLKNIDSVIERIVNKLNSLNESKVLPFGEDLGGVDLETVKVFTTRPDTIFGATFIALAPEVAKKITGRDFDIKVDTDRENKEKVGIDTGLKVKNPANGEMIPVFAVNYVSADYGTGAIMGVPAHDERDFEFAKKYNLPIVENYEKAGFEDFGKKITTFKLRDWIFSRQRYWGEPIPVINCEKCGIVPVPEKDLPIELPKVKNYQPTDSGDSLLANIKSFVDTRCPLCKRKAKRETDTMPNWAGSSWYYLRYTDPKNKKEFASQKNLKYWLTPPPNPLQRKGNEFETLPFGEGQGGVDWYNGGNEHTTLHLLYSRFWHKFLFDLKLVPTSEPYNKRTSHGMILGEGGVKMSKSLGNVINPDDIVKIYGADTLRIYEMFMGPFDQSVLWSTDGLIGPRRFIEKVWRIGGKVLEQKNSSGLTLPGVPVGTHTVQNSSIPKLLHKTIKKVSEDIEEMHFNTAISSMMILATEMEKAEHVSLEDFKKFLQILSPFAPHVAEELWENLRTKTVFTKNINFSDWPKWNENLIKDEEVKIAVQVNGKVRSEIMIQVDEKEENVRNKVLADPIVLKYIEKRDIKKIIYVKNRLINIVV